MSVEIAEICSKAARDVHAIQKGVVGGTARTLKSKWLAVDGVVASSRAIMLASLDGGLMGFGRPEM